MHGRRQGVQGGARATPWNLKIMTSYVICMPITLKIFARASGARIKYTYLLVKPQKFAKKLSFRFWCTKHDVEYCHSCSWKMFMHRKYSTCEPSWKNICAPRYNFCVHPPEYHPAGADGPMSRVIRPMKNSGFAL